MFLKPTLFLIYFLCAKRRNSSAWQKVEAIEKNSHSSQKKSFPLYLQANVETLLNAFDHVIALTASFHLTPPHDTCLSTSERLNIPWARPLKKDHQPKPSCQLSKLQRCVRDHFFRLLFITMAHRLCRPTLSYRFTD